MRLSAVRGFLRFCGVDDKLLAEVLDRPEVGTEHPYETVTDAELEALIAACDNPRDRAMIRLLRETGLRCEELCDAQVTDVHANDSNVPYLRVRHGKRNKMRDVPLSERAMGAVRALLEDTDRTMQSRGYLLLSRTGERLTTSRVRQVLIDARQGAGLSKEISAHSFRHTAATTWLRKGAKINDVAHLLGHSSLEATKRYVDHVELDELARIVGD
jgi:integrase/recombinase XerD